eukprot:TRINITY_DN376_c5_g1_i1.p1 TRINITY_DN376_c5_g1~~TRINITY_DN376_c5_g1_i1.p1  ORF type:complete len:396 (+),score=85.80 TRINITY_DN376_c5_g1_i1:174-1361(+)
MDNLISAVRASSKKIVIKLEKENRSEFPFDELIKKPLATQVSLRNNMIRELPGPRLFEMANIGWKITLTELNLSYNFLHQLPREISLFVHLKTLRIDNNNIQSLPKDIGKLLNLENLLMQYNSITELPLEMGQLVNLKRLDFTSNKVKRFPRSFAHLQQLRKVQYESNPLSYPPKNVLCLGWTSVRLYLAEPLKFMMENFKSTKNDSIRESQIKTLSYPHSHVPSGEIAEITASVKRCLLSRELRTAFGKFLEKECSLENLLFWQEVERLKNQEDALQPEDYLTEATKIFKKYIQGENDDALQVNLPFEIKEKCDQVFEHLLLEKKPSYNVTETVRTTPREDIRSVLNEAQTSIFHLLALDSYQRFLTSDEYKNSPESPSSIRAQITRSSNSLPL